MDSDAEDAARYRFVRDELMHDELDWLAALGSSEWNQAIDKMRRHRIGVRCIREKAE